MTDQERARERARKTINRLLSGRYKEGQWIYDVPNLGLALEEALLDFRKEALEESCRKVCYFCRMDWPVFRGPAPHENLWRHIKVWACKDNIEVGCSAQTIRELEE